MVVLDFRLARVNKYAGAKSDFIHDPTGPVPVVHRFENYTAQRRLVDTETARGSFRPRQPADLKPPLLLGRFSDWRVLVFKPFSTGTGPGDLLRTCVS